MRLSVREGPFAVYLSSGWIFNYIFCCCFLANQFAHLLSLSLLLFKTEVIGVGVYFFKSLNF